MSIHIWDGYTGLPIFDDLDEFKQELQELHCSQEFAGQLANIAYEYRQARFVSLNDAMKRVWRTVWENYDDAANQIREKVFND